MLCNSNFECEDEILWFCHLVIFEVEFFIKRGFKILIMNIIRGVNDKSVNKYVYKN